MLIRLGLAEWFVANNITIMKAVFTSVRNLVELLSAGSTAELKIASDQAEVIKNLGFGESLIMLILSALLSIIIIICGFFLIFLINSGLPSFAGNYADWAKTLIYLCELTFTIALTVGTVKGAQGLVSKALGI